MPHVKQTNGSVPAGPLLHFTLTIVLIGSVAALPLPIEGSGNTAPAMALPAPEGTQRRLASVHNNSTVRVLLSHRHNLGMTIKLRHFMGK